MPCYSRVTQTKILDADRLAEALRALGHEVLEKTDTLVRTRTVTFFRDSTKAGFSSYAASGFTAPIGVKYAELTARAWGKTKGFSVSAFDKTANKITMKRSR